MHQDNNLQPILIPRHFRFATDPDRPGGAVVYLAAAMAPGAPHVEFFADAAMLDHLSKALAQQAAEIRKRSR